MRQLRAIRGWRFQFSRCRYGVLCPSSCFSPASAGVAEVACASPVAGYHEHSGDL